MKPPQHAAVFCVDEKSAIQALDRLDPVLPMSPGGLNDMDSSTTGNGTLSLYAALEVRTEKAHKTKAVAEFLEANPKVRFHFTATYSSWLNQVEIWFSKIERDVIARGVFTSVTDLARNLRKYIRAYGKSAKPIRWTYTDARRRVQPVVTI